MQAEGKQEGVPTHTASAAVPASLPRSLFITPFSVQWLFGNLGRSQGQRSSTMICFCTASGCCEYLPVGAAVERGKRSWRPWDKRRGGAAWTFLRLGQGGNARPQSLSEPTAEEPFRFRLVGLGFVSSSSEALLEPDSSSALGGWAAFFRLRGLDRAAFRRLLGGLVEESSYSSAREKRSLNFIL